MKFTQIPQDTFQKLQLNAGIIASNFDVATGEVERADILGATTGGLTFSDTPEYTDFGEDIDNAPANTMELKRITGREVVASGTLLTVDSATAKKLMAAGTITPGTEGAAAKITPSDDLATSDFSDVWIIGDYSDENTGANAGFIAIHLMNVLNTGGFQLTTADKGKGQFAFTFTAHYSIETPDTVPYEVFIKSGSASEETGKETGGETPKQTPTIP